MFFFVVLCMGGVFVLVWVWLFVWDKELMVVVVVNMCCLLWVMYVIVWEGVFYDFVYG